MNDAGWLLVRTAARLYNFELRGLSALALPDDISDRRALSEALAAACGLSESQILSRIALRIMDRAEDLRYGVAEAAEMGQSTASPE